MHAANIIFQDNFDDGNADDWIVPRNMQWNNQSQPCYNKGVPANWEAKNGKYGISIDGPGCVTETVPNDSLWDDAWVNYIIDVDMEFVSGTDKNLAWRYLSPNKWYDVHFMSPGGLTFQLLPPGGHGISSANYPIPNGNTYHITVEVHEDNFKLLIDNNLVLDYYFDPANDRSPIGRVALQASVGSDRVSEVWFDNLVVTSIDEPVEEYPVVLLPGFGGSWNTSAIVTGGSGGNWKKTPFVKVYDNFKDTLINNAGYVEGDNYFEFYYDWRKPVDSLADDFKNYLDTVVAADKVNLVGHSMGGVVARAYAQKYGETKINKLVTVGSPHSGATKAWEAWSGAEIGTRWSWEWIALQLYLHIHKSGYLSPIQAIHNLTPSLHNLSPTFDFAKNSTGTVIDVNSMNDPNLYLAGLNSSISGDLIALLTTIAGHEDNQDKDTVEWIKLKQRSVVDRLLGKWPDGKPDLYEYTLLGDLTILDKSTLIAGAEQKTVQAQHNDLLKNYAGIESILESLEIEAEPITPTSDLPRNPALMFFLHSPANLKVTDPSGEDIGFGSSNPMSHGIYSPDDKLIVIYDAVAGNYQIEVIGTGTGDYDLDIGQLTLNGEKWSTIEENTYQGEVDQYTVNLSTNTTHDNPVVDETGKTYLILARYKLEKLKDYINDQDVSEADKRDLVAYINKLIILIDRGLLFIDMGNNNYAQRYTQAAMSGCYSLRLKTDILRFDNLINKQIKEQADEAGQLLLDGFVIILSQSSYSISQVQASRMISAAEGVKVILDSQLNAVSGENYSLGYVVNLAEEMLNKAQGSLGNSDFAKAYAQALLSRLLSLEAMRII
ncbi:alpha/beta fold hydrolase [Patescibacteria group bacterium]